MDARPTNHSPSPLGSALKWGMIYIVISWVLMIFNQVIVLLIFRLADVDMYQTLLSGVSGLTIFLTLLKSGLLVYFGMKSYKTSFKGSSFTLSDALKWIAIFAGLFLVVYGVSNLAFVVLSFVFQNGVFSMDSLYQALDIMLVPNLTSLAISCFVLMAFGLGTGAILKNS